MYWGIIKDGDASSASEMSSSATIFSVIDLVIILYMLNLKVILNFSKIKEREKFREPDPQKGCLIMLCLDVCSSYLRCIFIISCLVACCDCTDAGWWLCGWCADGSSWCSESVGGRGLTCHKRREKNSDTSFWRWCSQAPEFQQVWVQLLFGALLPS